LSLRTVEREVAHLRRELEAEALATVRSETPPGKQLQIDFGQRRVTDLCRRICRSSVSRTLLRIKVA